MDASQPTRQKEAESQGAIQLESMFQVVLFNDDHNSMEYVVLCLMHVFGHPMALAAKIMHEAHERGRAIAEVESETLARGHRDELQTHGLVATIEQI